MKHFTLIALTLALGGCATERVRTSKGWNKAGATDADLARDLISAQDHANRTVGRPQYPRQPKLPVYRKKEDNRDIVVVAGDNNSVRSGGSRLSTEMLERKWIEEERRDLTNEYNRQIQKIDQRQAQAKISAETLFMRSRGWKQVKNVFVYYTTGQKKSNKQYLNNKLNYCLVWKPNGEQCPMTKIVNGNGVVVEYDTDGIELSRTTYKNGIKDDF